MRGRMPNKYKGEEGFVETYFYFNLNEVKSFYVAKDAINIFLLYQGNIVLEYDDELVQVLETMFSA